MVSAELINKCQESKMLALTFDDGPTTYTETVLEILKKKGIKATFHFNTAFLNNDSRDLIQKCKALGHDVGLRTNSQRDYFGINNENVIKKDLEGQLNVLNKIPGSKVRFVRSPLKDNTPHPFIHNFFAKKKIIQTAPSYSPYDAKGSVKTALKNHLDILSPDLDSSIIVLYEDRLKVDKSLEELISIIRTRGFRIVPLRECVGNYDPSKGEPLKTSINKKESGIDSYVYSTAAVLLPYILF